MNFRKLITYLTMGTAAAMPLAVAQNPTILQGSYISNVFGNSNFIKNPNAQTNIADVTVSNATVTRSTTTPLVATSEFLVTTSTATGSATWLTRTFDAGMKGQNCEARFTYRGFSVGSTTAQILQGANVVAQLTLTASTDPRIASINFPCGDLSSATTFRLQQATASLTGTNEIGGIYVGLATNMANVAQAEFYGSLVNYGSNCLWTGVATFQAMAADNDCTTYETAGENLTPSTKIPAIQFTAKKSGNYQISLGYRSEYPTTVGGNPNQCAIYDGNTYIRATNDEYPMPAAPTSQRTMLTFNKELTAGTAYNFNLRCNVVTSILSRDSIEAIVWTIYRFPSSSELVVTPERQNVFGGVEWSATADWTGSSTSYTTVNVGSTWGSPVTFGSATAAGTSCGLAANDVGFCIDTLPPGTYKIGGNFQLGVVPSAANNFCAYSANIGGGTLTDNRVIDALPRSAASSAAAVPFINLGSGLFKVTSLQRNVRVWLHYRKDATATRCEIRADNANYYAKPSLNITPVDQPSNSALYVQGPVLGAQTGAAIPSGYQHEGITTVTNTITNQSQGAWKTGTGVTLQPGVWLVDVKTVTAVTAPTVLSCGITKTVNSATINDDRSFPTIVEVSDAGNTGSAKDCRSYGYFTVTTATTFYPANFITSPTASNYQISFSISAIRLN